MLRKVSIAILKKLLCFHCLTKLIICIKPLDIFISILFRNLQSLNRIQLPLLLFITLCIALLSRILCFHCLTKSVICLNSLVKSESHSVTSFHVDYVEYCLIKTVYMLLLSINAYNVLKFLGYLHINII